MLRIPNARLPMGSAPIWWRWRSCRQVSVRLFVEPLTCLRVNRVVVFFESFELLFFSLSYLLTARDGSVVLLGPWQVLVVQSFAFSILLEQSQVVDWVVASVLLRFAWESNASNFEFSQPVATYICVSKAILSDQWQRSPLRFARAPSWKYCLAAAVLFLTCLFQHLFRLVIHFLSFRRSVFGTTTAVLLDIIPRDWSNVVVALLELCWSLRRSHISSTTAIDYTDFSSKYCTQDNAVWKKLSQSSKISVLFKSALNSFSELVDLLRLAQVQKEEFLVLVVLELFNLLVFTCCILLFDCRKWYVRNSVVNGVVPSFSVTLRIAWWVPSWSCVFGFVDLVDHIASSIWVQPVAIL